MLIILTGNQDKTTVRVLMLAIFLSFFKSTFSLTGQDERCSNEGKQVYVDLVANDPCYKCFCRQGRVECDIVQCAPLDGCHAVLKNKTSGQCCDVCKGCTINGIDRPSGSVWYSDDNPCIIMTCQAGVVTTSREVCLPPCENPVAVPYQCCPTCSGCSYNNIDHQNGEKFRLEHDPNIECVCQTGVITCSKRACPVLNCPVDKMYQENGENCLKCKEMTLVLESTKSCFFSGLVIEDGSISIVDTCTFCVCEQGTMFCERKQCPALDCPIQEQITPPGSCCPRCSIKLPCSVGNIIIEHNETWNTDNYTTCFCNNGSVECETSKCLQTDSMCKFIIQANTNDVRSVTLFIKRENICSHTGQPTKLAALLEGVVRQALERFCALDLLRFTSQDWITVNFKYRVKDNAEKLTAFDTILLNLFRNMLQITVDIEVNKKYKSSFQFLSSDFFNKRSILRKANNWNLFELLTVKVDKNFNNLYTSNIMCVSCGDYDVDIRIDVAHNKGRLDKTPDLLIKLGSNRRICLSNNVAKDSNITTNKLCSSLGYITCRNHYKDKHGTIKVNNKSRVIYAIVNKTNSIAKGNRSRKVNNIKMHDSVEYINIQTQNGFYDKDDLRRKLNISVNISTQFTKEISEYIRLDITEHDSENKSLATHKNGDTNSITKKEEHFYKRINDAKVTRNKKKAKRNKINKKGRGNIEIKCLSGRNKVIKNKNAEYNTKYNENQKPKEKNILGKRKTKRNKKMNRKRKFKDKRNFKFKNFNIKTKDSITDLIDGKWIAVNGNNEQDNANGVTQEMKFANPVPITKIDDILDTKTENLMPTTPFPTILGNTCKQSAEALQSAKDQCKEISDLRQAKCTEEFVDTIFVWSCVMSICKCHENEDCISETLAKHFHPCTRIEQQSSTSSTSIANN